MAKKKNEVPESDGFGGMLDSICRGCGDWMSKHTGPPCPPVLPGFSMQRPPPWGLARAWSNLCETAEKMREHSESWRLAHASLETKLEALEDDFDYAVNERDAAKAALGKAVAERDSWRHNALSLEGAMNAASEKNAAFLATALNAHETLVTTLQRCRKSLENLRDYGADAADIAAELGIIDAALVLAGGGGK